MLETSEQAPGRRRDVDEPSRSVMEITGGRGGLSADALRESWEYREVLRAFVVRQAKVRYKQAVIGVGWAVLQPVLAAALFALFLGRLAGLGSEGMPYLLFALTGMVVWTFFSGAVTTGSDSLVSQQSLLRKLYFPRELLPLAALGVAVLDLLVGLPVVLIAAAAYRVFPARSWVVLPATVLPVLLFAAAVALAFSAVNVYYRDVRYIVPFLLQVGIFATPVVYSLRIVPVRWRTAYVILNPAAASIEALRDVVGHRTWPDFTVLAASTAWAIVLLVAAYAAFKRIERGFADRV
jgi:ABC-type polysaccharide/polyol phosphate export permease